MTGGDIIVDLLNAYAPLGAVVPATRIKLGALPDGMTLPALLVRTVSSIDRQTLKRRARVRQTDRTSVTVRAASFREQRAIIALVRAACAGRTGDLSSATGVSVLTAGLGPDLLGPGDSFEQAQDFKVSFECAA